MKKQKRSLLEKILIIIGILAVVFIISVALLIAFLAIKKPYGIDVIKIAPALIQQKSSATPSYNHPLLNTEQELLLESVGIDLKDVPTNVTPAQEECSKKILGEKRVAEIKAGSAPSITEALQVQSCFK